MVRCVEYMTKYRSGRSGRRSQCDLPYVPSVQTFPQLEGPSQELCENVAGVASSRVSCNEYRVPRGAVVVDGGGVCVCVCVVCVCVCGVCRICKVCWVVR